MPHRGHYVRGPVFRGGDGGGCLIAILLVVAILVAAIAR
jgi:hypothetical protein